MSAGQFNAPYWGSRSYTPAWEAAGMAPRSAALACSVQQLLCHLRMPRHADGSIAVDGLVEDPPGSVEVVATATDYEEAPVPVTNLRSLDDMGQFLGLAQRPLVVLLGSLRETRGIRGHAGDPLDD